MSQVTLKCQVLAAYVSLTIGDRMLKVGSIVVGLENNLNYHVMSDLGAK